MLGKFKELIFIGGGDYRKQENQDIDTYLASILRSSMKILIVPFASPQEKHESWMKTLMANFSKYDLTNFELLDENLSKEEMADKIESAEAIFIIGGLPTTLLAKIRKKDIEESFRKCAGVIIGYSAGAMVLPNSCIILPEGGYTKVEKVKGLGMCDFGIYVHYKEEHDLYLKQFSSNMKIYAISDRSALVYKDGELNYIGEGVYLFHKGKKTRVYKKDMDF